MTLARLIEAVEAGTFLMDVLPEHETTAYEAFSGSLDAAKRLHDALLPGWKWGAHEPAPGVSRFYVSKRSALRPMPTTHDAADPARAWLLAILRAMEGRDG